MQIFKTKLNEIGAIRSEIAKLEARKSALAADFDVANLALTSAQAKCRVAMIDGDGPEGNVLTEMKQAEGRRDLIADALKEIGRRLEDAQVRLTVASDRERREREAVACEIAATEVQKAAVDLDRAFVIAAEAFDRLADAVPNGKVALSEHLTSAKITGADLARAIFSEGLARRCPRAYRVQRFAIYNKSLMEIVVHSRRSSRNDGAMDMIVRGVDDGFEVLDASKAADVLVVDRLRTLAGAIRSGDAPLPQQHEADQAGEAEDAA